MCSLDGVYLMDIFCWVKYSQQMPRFAKCLQFFQKCSSKFQTLPSKSSLKQKIQQILRIFNQIFHISSSSATIKFSKNKTLSQILKFHHFHPKIKYLNFPSQNSSEFHVDSHFHFELIHANYTFKMNKITWDIRIHYSSSEAGGLSDILSPTLCMHKKILFCFLLLFHSRKCLSASFLTLSVLLLFC